LNNELTLLSIAGSDPSGGAGIQADLKTMTAVGVYGAAAVTCLTVQNSTGVKNILPLDPDFVRQQIQAVLDDHKVTHIKIGMLGSFRIVQMISKLLSTYKGSVIFDPVLAATTGESFLNGDSLERIKKDLLKHVTYLTPNKQELESLTGETTLTDNDGIKCAKLLLSSYPAMEGIIVKGGHFDEDESIINDFLILQNGEQFFSSRKRITTNNLHGTGCTFASAFSSYLLIGYPADKAFAKTTDFMDRIIFASRKKRTCKNDTNGPLLHYAT